MPYETSDIMVTCYRNLLNNPLNCDCHMRWFSEWLKLKQSDIVTGSPACQTPVSLVNSAVNRLSNDEFVCKGENSIPHKLITI